MSEKIVYVDDEHAVLRAMDRDLSPWLEQKDLFLETVDSAEACLDALERSSDNVLMVITDLRMPGIKGSELLEQLARRYPDVGLVLLTAYTDMDDITRAVSAHISGLIIKPWDVDRLTAELDRILTRVRHNRVQMRRQFELEAQLRIAGEFQERLFETPLPGSECYTVEVSSRPAPGIYVNGDFHDVIPLDDGRVLLMLGDVSGHGIKPAFVATMVKFLIAEQQVTMEGPEFELNEFLNRLNRELMRRLTGHDDVLVSCSVVLVDPVGERAFFSGGGCPPLCLIRHRSIERISTDSPALGFSEDISYTSRQIPIKPGDRLVLLTDGVYDRGTDASVSWDVLSAVFVQADGAAGFVKQVERVLSAVDILHSPAGANVRTDDLSILTYKYYGGHGCN